MGDRRKMLDLVSEALGDRDLYWAGLRRDDVEAISDLPQLAGSFSIVGGHGCRTAVRGVDFEQLWGSRVDLDAWDMDDHLGHDAVMEYRDEILRTLLRPSALLPYRPTRFLSSIAFSRRERCRYLGLFNEHQAAFDHKPWVESSMADLGVPHVEWTYVADEERRHVERMLADGPIMVRPSRTSGGVGLYMVDDAADIDGAWPQDQDDSYAGIAPYLPDAVPVNIGATVWRDGHVTMGHASVQVIGVPELTEKPFGYCGNDFGLIKDLDGAVVDAIEAGTVAVGAWLGRHGYVGAFGVDYLVNDGEALFTEVNPRFQGSTHASCQLSVEADESCAMLDHLGAFLGVESPDRPPLRDMVASVPAFSHLVVHWQGDTQPVDVEPLAEELREGPGHARTDMLADADIDLERGAIAARTVTRATVTSSGFDLAEPWSSKIASWANSAEEEPQ